MFRNFRAFRIPRSMKGIRFFQSQRSLSNSRSRFFIPALLGATTALVGYSATQNDLSQEKRGVFSNKLVAHALLGSSTPKVPIYGNPGTKEERTFIAIKPDGVNRNLIGEIIGRFERKGYKLVAIKILVPSKDLAAKHYDDLKSKPFFPGLVEYFSSGPVVAMVFEGLNVISGGRTLIGATNPQTAALGSIRGDLCIQAGRNIIHGSDSPESAKNEISLWFKEEEVANYQDNEDKWLNEVN